MWDAEQVAGVAAVQWGPLVACGVVPHAAVPLGVAELLWKPEPGRGQGVVAFPTVVPVHSDGSGPGKPRCVAAELDVVAFANAVPVCSGDSELTVPRCAAVAKAASWPGPERGRGAVASVNGVRVHSDDSEPTGPRCAAAVLTAALWPEPG